MARNEHQRQRKLAARKNQRKIAATRQVQRQALSTPTARISQAGQHNWPVVHSRVASTLWTNGIGQVAIARVGPQGTCALVIFLVDTWCLGVKRIIQWAGPEAEARIRLQLAWANDPQATNRPAAEVRKLIEEVTRFATGLGLPPHPDLATACQIFGNLNPADCPTEFQFGHDGVPAYAIGPRDSEEFALQVIRTLERSVHERNFNLVISDEDSASLPSGRFLPAQGNDNAVVGQEVRMERAS